VVDLDRKISTEKELEFCHANTTADQVLLHFAESSVPKMWGKVEHPANSVQALCSGCSPTEEAEVIDLRAERFGRARQLLVSNLR